MRVVLIDNGSLEPAAHLNLRRVASAIAGRSGIAVHPVSWKHSDRIAPAELDGTPAWSLAPFIRSAAARGERAFAFLPFFISAQGAVGSALRRDLEDLRAELGHFDFAFLPGLAALQAIPRIAAERIRTAIAGQGLHSPPILVVDHGGPSPASALLRDHLAAEIRTALGGEIGPLAAASMEGDHPPLLAEQLRAPELRGRDVIVSLLFLSPGRHAGPDGDIARICAASPARCHLTGLIGTHPLAVELLADALRQAAPNHFSSALA